MLKDKKALFFVFILSLFVGLQAQEKKEILSLENCILKAMENNLNIAVEVLNPELADRSVSMTREKFLPSITFGYNFANRNLPSFSLIEAEERLTSNYYDYSAIFTQFIPTGGSFSLTFSSYRRETNRRFVTINPRYGSTLTFEFKQPLLRNFGFKTSRRDIIIARNNRDISESEFKSVLMDTIFDVENAYWNLVHSIEDLEVRKQSLNLAQDLLTKNKKQVDAGTLAPLEILSAQSEVATREADILEAEAAVKNNEDQLKTIINLAAGEEGVGIEIIPIDKPGFTLREVSFEEAFAIAQQNRPDLQATRIEIKSKGINLSYFKNQLLPDLSIDASYFSPGISGTRVIYDPNDFFGPPVTTIPGGSYKALKDAFGFKFNNWSVGITLSIPFNTIFSRAQHARAKVDLQQTMLRLKDQDQKVMLEIKNAVRAVKTDYKRVQAYGVARELAERKLEAEEKKLIAGLTTNYVILQYQRDLANARSAELKAVIDYNLSLAQLDRTMGISLKNNNIKLSIH